MFLYRLSVLSLVTATVLACSGKEPARNDDTTSTTHSTSPDESADGGSDVGSSSGGSSTGRSTSVGGKVPSSCDVQPIMQKSCSGPACHGAPGQPAKYYTDFFNPPDGKTIEEVLLGKAANYNIVSSSAACPTDDPELLIDPTAPSESLMLTKIQGTHACGFKMPNSKSTLTQEQIDCFVDWVNAITSGSGAGGGTSKVGGTGGNTYRSGSGNGGTSSRSGGGSSTQISNTGGGSSTRSSGGQANGGTSTKATTSGIAPTFETVKTILTENVTSCVGSDCHGGHEGRLDLRVNSGLLDRLTSSTSELCGMPTVDPGQPNNSALVKLLREGCGEVGTNCMVGTECIPRMPIGCAEGTDCIPEEYIKAVEQWIEDGAEP